MRPEFAKREKGWNSLEVKQQGNITLQRLSLDRPYRTKYPYHDLCFPVTTQLVHVLVRHVRELQALDIKTL